MKDACWMINKPKVALVYVFVTGGHPHWSSLAHRFATKLRENPAGMDHETIIVCNGPEASPPEKNIFDGLPNLRFIVDDDRAYDISAYQTAAQNTNADLIVFLGGSSYPTGPGWGLRMIEIWRAFGSALYGAMGHQGNQSINVYPHLRTTGFWMERVLFNRYPTKVSHVSQRYEFEHGRTSLTGWIRQMGLPALVAGWNDVVDLASADRLPNGFHQGDQSNLLFKDRLCEPPYYHG